MERVKDACVVLKKCSVRETKVIFLFYFAVFLGAFDYNYIAISSCNSFV